MRRNLTLNPATFAVLAAGGILAAAASMALLRPTQAVAQVPPPAPTPIVSFEIRQMPLAAVTVLSASDFREVIAVPEKPVFITRNNTSISVYELRQGGLVRLTEFPTPANFRKITLMGDNNSFIVESDRALFVYPIDMRITPVATPAPN